MMLSRYVVPALALVLFTSACARHAQHQARAAGQTTAAPATVNAPKAEVTVAHAEIGPIRTKQYPAFKIFQDEGADKGKCTAGVVASFAWQQAHRPRLEGAVTDAIHSLEAAKAAKGDVAAAGRAVRAAYDLNMPSVIGFDKHYGTFACEVPGTPTKIIGSDQIAGEAAKIEAYVKSEPAVPARVK